MKRKVRGLGLILMILMIAAESNAQSFVNFSSSNLPIVVINTHGASILDEPKIPADMGIIDNGAGIRNNLTDTFNNYNGRIGIEFRGSSSQMFPKKQFAIELRDVNGAGVDSSLLGMPKKDDWVLFAPYDDKSLMRDALAYKLGRDQGRYASRARYCELVLNGSYKGVYVLLEKVKRDKNRVNIAKLEPTETTDDNVTGGYLFKIDKSTGSGGDGWVSPYPPPGSAGNQRTYFLYDYPKQEEIVAEQKTYIKSYVDAFETVLAGDNFKDPNLGYAHYIDVPSFIDFLIMSEITKNVDAYRLSTYLYKMKDSDGGKLYMGPIWDFNLGFGNADYCTQGNPEGFVLGFNHICPDDYWQIPFWWNRLLEDEAFSAQLAARWASLRGGAFQETRIQDYVDSVAAVLNAESQQRNFSAWPVLGQYVWPNYFIGQTFQEEVNWLKSWITQRLAWLDVHLPGLTTAVGENVSSFSIHAFPNPFVGEIKLEYELDRPGILEVDLFDMLGRKIDRLERNHDKGGKYDLDFKAINLAAGTYFFNARFGDRRVTQKVIKRP